MLASQVLLLQYTTPMYSAGSPPPRSLLLANMPAALGLTRLPQMIESQRLQCGKGLLLLLVWGAAGAPFSREATHAICLNTLGSLAADRRGEAHLGAHWQGGATTSGVSVGIGPGQSFSHDADAWFGSPQSHDPPPPWSAAVARSAEVPASSRGLCNSQPPPIPSMLLPTHPPTPLKPRGPRLPFPSLRVRSACLPPSDAARARPLLPPPSPTSV